MPFKKTEEILEDNEGTEHRTEVKMVCEENDDGIGEARVIDGKSTLKGYCKETVSNRMTIVSRQGVAAGEK